MQSLKLSGHAKTVLNNWPTGKIYVALSIVIWAMSNVSLRVLGAGSDHPNDQSPVAAGQADWAMYQPTTQLNEIQNRLGKEFENTIRFSSFTSEIAFSSEGESVTPAFGNFRQHDATEISRPPQGFETGVDAPESVSQYKIPQGYFGGLMKESLEMPYRIRSDYASYLSRESLFGLGLGLGVGAAIANTSADSDMFRAYFDWAKDPATRAIRDPIHETKIFGEGKVMLPIYLATWGVSTMVDSPRLMEPIGEWGSKSIRGFIVGAPSMIAFQWVTGASRPWETTHGSEWQFMNDNNGVSGHSFMGSLPFITAAKMSDRLSVKTIFYACSTLTPISRVNDSDHFPSQAMLGWWFAYMAATAVDATDNPNHKWHLYPFANANGSGLAAEFKW